MTKDKATAKNCSIKRNKNAFGETSHTANKLFSWKIDQKESKKKGLYAYTKQEKEVFINMVVC
jgi:hypothetical protein